MPDGTEMAGVADVWVEAEGRGDEYVVQQDRLFGVRDLTGAHRGQVRGRSNSVTKEKQNFQGLDASYEFDVATESYRRAGRLDEPRWYPTLINLEDGRILAVSGLDEYGRVLPGDNEIYDPATRTWTDQPQLFRYFPTYPALFRLADGKRIFYSGSNTGYGPHDQGRQPGIWNLADNTWVDVPGLEDPEYNETSASFFLAPVQEQRVGIVGGGLVGDSDESTARFNVVDLSSAEPRYAPGPGPPEPGAVHERRHPARRHHAAHRRFGGLPGQRRERPAPDDEVRPALRHAARGGYPTRWGATITPRRCCCPTAGS